MIQIRKEENQKKQKEKKLKVYKVNTHKKTVIALWVLLAVSFLFAVYKNFTAIDIHTVHETKVIEETILDTHKIENFWRISQKSTIHGNSLPLPLITGQML